MNIPRFEEHLRSTPGVDPGDAFQNFAYDLLCSDYPGLHLYRTSGNDGGIDLIQTTARPERVFECKYIGNDDLSEAKKRWKEVETHLTKNIADSAGPKRSLYAPWYRTNPGISHYVLCVSSFLKAQANFAELQQAIRQFFHQLGATHPHLQHLASISVEIFDWSHFSARLQAHPHLLFRWFTNAIPGGLAPLERVATAGAFSSFLSSEKLPYYSRKDHFEFLGTSPTLSIPDEEAVLRQLEGNVITGLIITGKGGLGKTRLTLELGRLAASKGWVVLRVGRSCKEDDLDRLMQRLNPTDRALLLIDYVETQPNFAGLTYKLNELKEEHGFHVRYLANCRKSYYQSSVAKEYWQAEVDVSPDETTSGITPQLKAWFEHYRQRIVVHVLDQCEVADPDRYLEICRDIPVFAVFVAYLQSHNRQEDLHDLLAVNDFKTWIAKRVQMSFGAQSGSADLARLIALFPISTAVLTHPALAAYREPLSRLATDGWIEQFPADEQHDTETVRPAHDVLADQILLTHFEKLSLMAAGFIHELFALGREIGCLNSVLFALQRLITQPGIGALDWRAILNREITAQPVAWQELRNLLIRTPLLTEPERIELLARYETFWEGAEDEPDFHGALGSLARWASEHEEAFTDEALRETLTEYLRKAAPHAERSNFYVLRRGLRFAPQALKEPVLGWIRRRKGQLKIQHLLGAWLNSGLPADEITSYTKLWLEKFCYTAQFSFVAAPWLRATGKDGAELVKQPLSNWLAQHKLLPEAQFVYNAWLDATQDRTLVEAALRDWFEQHRLTSDASYVYKAWLYATQDRTFVEDLIRQWLAAELDGRPNKLLPEAQFVYNAWLNATQDKMLVEAPIREWLDAEHDGQANRQLFEASHVYAAWLNATKDGALVRNSLRDWLAQYKLLPEASHVYTAWLDATQDGTLVEDALRDWLTQHKLLPEARFVYPAWLGATQDRMLVEDALRDWLTQHKLLPEAQFVYTAWLNATQDGTLVEDTLRDWLTQHKLLVEASYVYKAWLDATQDRTLVEDALRDWLTQHKLLVEASYVYKAWLDATQDGTLVEDALRDWLAQHKLLAEASHVYKAWLDATQDRTLVEDALRDWLVQHKLLPEARFVYPAWLDATQDRMLIEDALCDWLAQHKLLAEARFVYCAWLGATQDMTLVEKAGGKKAMVLAAILAWLTVYGQRQDADFLYRAWLENGFEFAAIQDHVIKWLSQNYHREEAVFITKYLVRQKLLPKETIKHVLRWCSLFPKNEDVLWRLSRLGRKILMPAVANEVCETIETVIPAVLNDSSRLDSTAVRQVNNIFSVLSESYEFIGGSLRQRSDILLAEWVRNTAAFDDRYEPEWFLQRPDYFQRVVELLKPGLLTLPQDRMHLVRFFRWVNRWTLEHKEELDWIIELYRDDYPDPELWDIIQTQPGEDPAG